MAHHSPATHALANVHTNSAFSMLLGWLHNRKSINSFTASVHLAQNLKLITNNYLKAVVTIFLFPQSGETQLLDENSLITSCSMFITVYMFKWQYDDHY